MLKVFIGRFLPIGRSMLSEFTRLGLKYHATWFLLSNDVSMTKSSYGYIFIEKETNKADKKKKRARDQTLVIR